jgi:hypothetical protein
VRGLIAIAALGLAGCGGAHHEPSPPVSAGALRQAIARSGLHIRWHDGRAGGRVVADLAGTARNEAGAGRVEFELAVTRGRADIHDLGRARFPLRFDPASGSPIDLYAFTRREIDVYPRGVLSNVAYVTWFWANDDEVPAARVSARLDAAVLSAFPPGDAEAHPILDKPRD